MDHLLAEGVGCVLLELVGALRARLLRLAPVEVLKSVDSDRPLGEAGVVLGVEPAVQFGVRFLLKADQEYYCFLEERSFLHVREKTFVPPLHVNLQALKQRIETTVINIDDYILTCLW